MAGQRDFVLDPRLEQDSEALLGLGLSELRLMRDARWPWLILVPRRTGLSEIFDLEPEEQILLLSEVTMVGDALKAITRCDKINIGAIGNIVRQLHVHVIARHEGDEHWPKPVWGHGTARPWDASAADLTAHDALIHRLKEYLAP